MNTVSLQYVETILYNVATSLKIKELKYDMACFKDIGQNYFGELIPVILCGQQDKNYVQLHIVLKLAPLDERYRVSGAITAMFAREIFIYKTVLKEYHTLQIEFQETSKYIIPNLFYTCEEYCKEVLVLENMCKKGYRPYLQSMFLDLDHISIAIKSLGKLHALSFILKEKNKELYQNIECICVPLSEKTNKRYMDILTDRLEKALVNFKGSKYELLLDELRHNCTKIIESSSTAVKKLCICHGDIWKENILYQYMEDKPISACLIDYQTMRLSSPAFDVLYLIVSSTNSLLRKNYFYNLLDIYYEAITFILSLHNIDTNMYSREMLDFDLSVVGPACFIVANTAMWLSNGLQQEGHVRSKKKLSTDEEKIKALNDYKGIVKDLLDDLKSYGYLEINL